MEEDDHNFLLVVEIGFAYFVREFLTIVTCSYNQKNIYNQICAGTNYQMCSFSKFMFAIYINKCFV